MKLRREIRGYSRTSGVHLKPASKLWTIGPSLLVIAAVIGVCGLATLATAQTDRLVASASPKTNIEKTTSVTAQRGETTGQPATLMQPIPVLPTSDKAGGATTFSRLSATNCKSIARSAIAAKRVTQLRAEAAKHQQNIWSLQTTGIVTKFLNPYMYSYRMSSENSRHQTAVKQIQQTYHVALLRAHCKQ